MSTKSPTKAELAHAIGELGGTPDTRKKRAELLTEFERLWTEKVGPVTGVLTTLGELRDAVEAGNDPRSSSNGHEPEETPQKPAEEPTTAVVVREAPPAVTLPEVGRWEQMRQMSVELAKSALVPDKLRNRPEDVLLILLGAHDLGISGTQALQKLHVIDGKVGMAAELMVALVLSAGHEIWPDEENDESHAKVYGKRKGSEKVGSFEFTIDEADAAGLIKRARGQKARGVWDNYPRAMLWARAVSGLCRQVFPDVLAGVSYTPEELDSITPIESTATHERPTITDVDPNRPAAPAKVDAIRKSIAKLTDDQKDALAAAWNRAREEHRIHALGHLLDSEVEVALRLIADVRTEHPEDAVVVDESTPDPADELAVDADQDAPALCVEPGCDQPAVDDSGKCAEHDLI